MPPITDRLVYRVVETDKIVGRCGWRWPRSRAVRYAAQLNALRAPTSYGYSYRFEVRRAGFGRWSVIALQNTLQAEYAEGTGA